MIKLGQPQAIRDILASRQTPMPWSLLYKMVTTATQGASSHRLLKQTKLNDKRFADSEDSNIKNAWQALSLALAPNAGRINSSTQ